MRDIRNNTSEVVDSDVSADAPRDAPRWQRVLVWGIVLGLAALAVGDAMIYVTPAQVAAGEPFVYWTYVNQHWRPPLALVLLLILALWGFLRPLFGPLRALRPIGALLLVLTCCGFSIIAPLRQLDSTAVHIQSQLNGGHVVHLFYQNYGILEVSCDHVVVRCDTLGLVCEFVTAWAYSPVCMGTQAPIQLKASGVMIDGELVLIWSELP